MITAEASGLALKLAKGSIKLAKQVDLVLAEKKAVEIPVSLPVPITNLRPSKPALKEGLQKLLKETPSPLSKYERQAIEKALEENDLGPIYDHVRHYLPELANSRNFDPDKAFMEALKKSRPDWAADPDLVAAAFYLGPGRDEREKSYCWRLSLTVIDVLAEFGAENMALFTRDTRVQSVVGSVLKRLGESDLQKLDSTHATLRAVLAATLNGALDVRDSLQTKNPWIDGLVDALGRARDAEPEADRDEFLIGLVRGRGYPLLVASVLETAAIAINDDKVDDFRDVAADFLKQVSGIVKQKTDFEDFFENHWSDLLRAGLGAVSSNAPALVGDKKLLGKILAQVAGDLARHDHSKLLSTDALFGIVNSTAAVVAADPALATRIFGNNKDWVDKLIVSVAETVSDQGIRKVFSQEGVESLFKDTFTTFSKHPELLAGDSKLAAALVKQILTELSTTGSFAAGDLAKTAVGGALTALAENPGLIDLKYPDLVASFAGKIGTLVKSRSLTGIQANELLDAGISILAENPTLFLDLESTFIEKALDAILRSAKNRPPVMVAGITLARLGREVLTSLARKGQAALDTASPVGGPPLGIVISELERLLNAGLDRAGKELGNALSLTALPKTIGLLVEAWADGEIAIIDPENTRFITLFDTLAAKAA